MTDNPLVEAVARALYEEYVKRPGVVRESAREGPLRYYPDAWTNPATAALRAIEEAGYQLVKSDD